MRFRIGLTGTAKSRPALGGGYAPFSESAFNFVYSVEKGASRHKLPFAALRPFDDLSIADMFRFVNAKTKNFFCRKTLYIKGNFEGYFGTQLEK